MGRNARTMTTWYDVLHLSPQAGDEEVRRAYLALARRWHPDRHPAQRQAQAARRFRRICQAYSFLKTKPQRQAYNRYLLRQIRMNRQSATLPVRRAGRFMRAYETLREIFWPFYTTAPATHKWDEARS